MSGILARLDAIEQRLIELREAIESLRPAPLPRPQPPVIPGLPRPGIWEPPTRHDPYITVVD